MKITNINYHNIDWIVKPKYEGIQPKVAQEVKQTDIAQKPQKETLEKMSKRLKEISKKDYIVRISIHEKTKHFIIKILDPETKQVVREMPWEKFLDLIVAMQETFNKTKGK